MHQDRHADWACTSASEGGHDCGCSVQGFGAPSEEAGHLYPGSGATVDSRIPARVQSIVENGDVAMVTEDGSGVTQVADADTGEVDEFVASGEEAAPALAGPHIINVGISGPGELCWPQGPRGALSWAPKSCALPRLDSIGWSACDPADDAACAAAGKLLSAPVCVPPARALDTR